jgi:hypothetical protein
LDASDRGRAGGRERSPRSQTNGDAIGAPTDQHSPTFRKVRTRRRRTFQRIEDEAGADAAIVAGNRVARRRATARAGGRDSAQRTISRAGERAARRPTSRS